MKNYLHQSWRHYTIHLVAKALGLLVHIEGFPYGRAALAKDATTETKP
jgi:hypothetical protein